MTDTPTPPAEATDGMLPARACSRIPTQEDAPIVDSSWDFGGFDDEDDFAEDDDCHFCGGEGWVDGDDLGDPGWYLPGELYKCTGCGGSGKGADCTFW